MSSLTWHCSNCDGVWTGTNPNCPLCGDNLIIDNKPFVKVVTIGSLQAEVEVLRKQLAAQKEVVEAAKEWCEAGMKRAVADAFKNKEAKEKAKKERVYATIRLVDAVISMGKEVQP
jgi:hypothetical protein